MMKNEASNSSSRLEGLPAAALDALRQSSRASERRDLAGALNWAREAARLAPDHPETLRRLALMLVAGGPSPDAIALIERAVAQRPQDALLANAQAIVLSRNGRSGDAIEALARAYALQPDSVEIAYGFGRACAVQGDAARARPVLERIVAAAPDHRDARATLAMVAGQMGDTDVAIAEYRELLRRQPDDVRVWSALATINAGSFSAEDLASLRRLAKRPDLDVEHQIRIRFALARACESRAEYAEAFAEYCKGSELMHRQCGWDATRHSQEVENILRAFDKPHADAERDRGKGIVFIVSMPRSGSTLTEQILATHPQVSAGDERTDLLDIIAAEGQRRSIHFSAWATQANAQDWQRLGNQYLERIAPLRDGKAVFTDKLPGNWLWLGAALAMLPGARVIDARRDVLETAWSCFRHLFPAGTQDFSYDFASIAAFSRDHDRAMQHWHRLYPDRIRTQVYEKLVIDPEAQIRELLAFCNLDFDPACLNFHQHQRAVRTASAAQVRAPLRRDTARTGKYGALLDPLRAELGLPPFAA
jgi:tetratricopeptide (TPR) repeat protein